MRARAHVIAHVITGAIVVLSGCAEETGSGQPPDTILWEQTDPLLIDPVTALTVGLGGEIVAGTQSNGVFRSTDFGGRWQRSDAGITDSFIRSLVTSESGSIFVGTEGASVFRSTDVGQTWAARNVGLPGALAVSSLASSSSGTIFAATASGIFLSRDDGENWSPTSVVSAARSIHAALNTQVLVATSDGIFRSVNDGQSWDRISKFDATAVVGDSRGGVFAGVERGVQRSVGGGDFTPVEFTGALVFSLAVDPSDQLYAGTFDLFGLVDPPPEGIFRSQDTGATWDAQNEGLTDLSTIVIALDESRGIAYIGTRRGVFRSVGAVF